MNVCLKSFVTGAHQLDEKREAIFLQSPACSLYTFCPKIQMIHTRTVVAEQRLRRSCALTITVIRSDEFGLTPPISPNQHTGASSAVN
ncbi:MAG TPA: hypothetical protein VMZ05_10905 [Spirochaetota bacterium]|nr:hypothetical protein [Spirochaetota bacterium]